MDKQNNSLVNKFLKQINKIIDYKLNKLTTVESAIVDQVNTDGSVNLHIPPDSTIFTGIQNQSIYKNLQVGDCVKVLKQSNKASNMWIIGGHNLKRDNSIEDLSNHVVSIKKTIEGISSDMSNIADYIVEQNMNPDGWSYTKYASGKCELYRVIVTRFKNAFVLGGDDNDKDFPFELTAVYCAVCGMQAIDNKEIDVRTHAKVNYWATGAYVWVHSTNGSFSSDYKREVSVYIIGRWKE